MQSHDPSPALPPVSVLGAASPDPRPGQAQSTAVICLHAPATGAGFVGRSTQGVDCSFALGSGQNCSCSYIMPQPLWHSPPTTVPTATACPNQNAPIHNIAAPFTAYSSAHPACWKQCWAITGISCGCCYQVPNGDKGTFPGPQLT